MREELREGLAVFSAHLLGSDDLALAPFDATVEIGEEAHADLIAQAHLDELCAHAIA